MLCKCFSRLLIRWLVVTVWVITETHVRQALFDDGLDESLLEQIVDGGRHDRK